MLAISEWLQLSGQVREVYLKHRTFDTSYEQLMTVYEGTIARSRIRGRQRRRDAR
jgi:hypothetical protein